MKTILHPVLIYTTLMLPLSANLYVSDFTALNGSAGASGVWRNQGTMTNLATPVTLSQTGGTVKPEDGSSTESITDDGFPWQALPIIAGGADAFSPHFDGDFINVQTPEGGTSTITLDFHATVVDPVISFTDVEYRTIITFPHPFEVLASTSNLSFTATTLTSDKSVADGDSFGLFGQEAAGSIKFTGSFDKIVFTVAVGIGDASVGNNDRTGYVISTTTEPVPRETTAPVLSVEHSSGSVMLSWTMGEFSAIQISGVGEDLGSWADIPGLDPGAVATWSDTIANLGGSRFFRGVYP